jgi:hypothetical protein
VLLNANIDWAPELLELPRRSPRSGSPVTLPPRDSRWFPKSREWRVWVLFTIVIPAWANVKLDILYSKARRAQEDICWTDYTTCHSEDPHWMRNVALDLITVITAWRMFLLSCVNLLAQGSRFRSLI